MSVDWENIILLSTDALRADHLSCHGYDRDTSPVICELASEGLQFMNAYSASSHTREAVPALLTGEYPDTAVDSGYNLATDTIASTLSDAGYATGGFHSNPFISRAYGFGEGFDTFDDDLHFGNHKLVALAQRAFDKLRNRHYARANEINERSLTWLDSFDDNQPFFLWNHYMDTHGPYEPPKEYATLFRDDTVSTREAHSLYQRAIRNPESITSEERQLLIDLYDAEIRYNDEKIGVFLNALQDRNLLERSLVLFTADHGDAFGEHGYYEHPRYLHDEITHVPLIIRTPGGPTGTETAPVSSLDIAATVTQKETNEGISLLHPPDEKRRVFSQARGESEQTQIRRYAVRSAEGSCFCERNRKTGEIKFTMTEGQALQDELRTHAEERTRVENTGDKPAESDVDQEVERRLSALGYKD